mgnify:CR=1 FL=1
MNYPKIGCAYKLTQDLSFVAVSPCEDGRSPEILHKGEVVHFLTCAIHGPNVSSVGSQDILVCYLSNDTRGKFVVTYKVLIELVQSGALVSFIKEDIHKNLDIRIDQLGLPVRTRNMLLQMPDVVTVKDLVSNTEVDLLRVIGLKALAQIKIKLSELGVSLMPNR